MKKNYIEPSVKVALVSAERMICGSKEVSINGEQDAGYEEYGAWGKEDNEDIDW